jgi:hypothetical protein
MATNNEEYQNFSEMVDFLSEYFEVDKKLTLAIVRHFINSQMQFDRNWKVNEAPKERFQVIREQLYKYVSASKVLTDEDMKVRTPKRRKHE